MKSTLDNNTREELVGRINSLTQQHQANWGKMNVYQMLKHCTLCEDMNLGNMHIKRVLIGRLIGGMFLKKILKDDAPFGKNSPTSGLLKIAESSGDIEQQKREWISRLSQYAGYDKAGFVHPFFGKLSKEQVGRLSYKHADHHLRQFGV